MLPVPPLVEFLESLLSGIGEDLDLQTFKVTDQVSGKLMGVRADITPQVARIDAHRLKTDFRQRLCYLGPVLHTKPDTFAGSTSIPVTENPASANTTASGSPTYPRPITQILASRRSIFLFRASTSLLTFARSPPRGDRARAQSSKK